MSASGILGAIDKEKYEVVPIGITRAGEWLPRPVPPPLLAGDAPHAPHDCEAGSPSTALVADPGAGQWSPLTGPGLRDRPCSSASTSPSLCSTAPMGRTARCKAFELANIPYVGAGVLGSALGMDKVKMKELLRYHGLPVPEWVSFRRWQWLEDGAGVLRQASRFGFPCFVKPANLGSSVGVSKAHDPGELPARPGGSLPARREDPGRGGDRRPGDRGGRAGEPPATGLRPRGGRPLQRVLRLPGKVRRRTLGAAHPGPLPGALAERFRTLAIDAFLALECAGMARVDFFCTASPVRLRQRDQYLPALPPSACIPSSGKRAASPTAS